MCACVYVFTCYVLVSISFCANKCALLQKRCKHTLKDQIENNLLLEMPPTPTMQVLELQRRVQGPEHPLTLTAAVNLAESLRQLGRLSEAEAILQQVSQEWAAQSMLGENGARSELRIYPRSGYCLKH